HYRHLRSKSTVPILGRRFVRHFQPASRDALADPTRPPPPLQPRQHPSGSWRFGLGTGIARLGLAAGCKQKGLADNWIVRQQSSELRRHMNRELREVRKMRSALICTLLIAFGLSGTAAADEAAIKAACTAEKSPKIKEIKDRGVLRWAVGIAAPFAAKD